MRLETALLARGDVRLLARTFRAAEVLQLALMRHPDLVFSSAQIEQSSALLLFTSLHLQSPQSRLVLVTEEYPVADLPAFLEIGVTDQLVWDDLAGDQLDRVLDLLIAGQRSVNVERLLAAYVDSQLAPGGARGDRRQRAILRYGLTPAEYKLWAYLARGYDNHQIAGALNRSYSTVSAQLSRLYDKLNVQCDRAAIARFILEAGCPPPVADVG